jgi:hypothetical protein
VRLERATSRRRRHGRGLGLRSGVLVASSAPGNGCDDPRADDRHRSSRCRADVAGWRRGGSRKSRVGVGTARTCWPQPRPGVWVLSRSAPGVPSAGAMSGLDGYLLITGWAVRAVSAGCSSACEPVAGHPGDGAGQEHPGVGRVAVRLHQAAAAHAGAGWEWRDRGPPRRQRSQRLPAVGYGVGDATVRGRPTSRMRPARCPRRWMTGPTGGRVRAAVSPGQGRRLTVPVARPAGRLRRIPTSAR